MKVYEFYESLYAPFQKKEVKWRLGASSKEKLVGQALAYVDARTVYNRLDDVCTFFGWQCNYSHAAGPETKTICNLGLYLPIGGPHEELDDVEWQWIWRANGAGDSDFEGEKGAISDALKRAAVTFGIGRYLYSLPSPWVKCEMKGRSMVIKTEEYSKLESELEKASNNADYGTLQERAAMAIASSALNFMPTEDARMEFVQKNNKAIAALSTDSRNRFREKFQELRGQKKEEDNG